MIQHELASIRERERGGGQITSFNDEIISEGGDGGGGGGGEVNHNRVLRVEASFILHSIEFPAEKQVGSFLALVEGGGGRRREEEGGGGSPGGKKRERERQRKGNKK